MSRSKLRAGSKVGWFLALDVWPVVAAFVIALAGVGTFLDPLSATLYRYAIIAAGALLLAAQIIKAVRGRRAEQSKVRTVVELYDRLGPALDLTSELALLDPPAREQKLEALKAIAVHLCGTLEALVGQDMRPRVTVFSLTATAIEPIAVSGARESPRAIILGTARATEVVRFLKGPRPHAELYRDLAKDAPLHSKDQQDGFVTLVRVPIYARSGVFGMVTIESRKVGTLTEVHKAMAELVATTIAPAFALVVTQVEIALEGVGFIPTTADKAIPGEPPTVRTAPRRAWFAVPSLGYGPRGARAVGRTLGALSANDPDRTELPRSK